MAWCVECWSDGRRTINATKVLDAEDLCDLHYRKALGPGLALHAATLHGAPPLPASAPSRAAVAPAEAQPVKPAPEAVDDKKSSAPPEAAKEKESMANKGRPCACKPGCPEIAKSNSSPYARGHNPNKKTATASAGNGKEKTPRKIRGGQESNGGEASVHIPLTVTVPLRGEHLDVLWARLSLQEKADKLFPAE